MFISARGVFFFFFFGRVVFAYLSACGQDIAKSTLEILVKCDGKARVAQKKKMFNRLYNTSRTVSPLNYPADPFLVPDRFDYLIFTDGR